MTICNEQEYRLEADGSPDVVFLGSFHGEWSSQYPDGEIRDDRLPEERFYRAYLVARLYRSLGGTWVCQIRQVDPKLHVHPKRVVVTGTSAAELGSKLRSYDFRSWWPIPYSQPREGQVQSWAIRQQGIERRFDVVLGHISRATGEEVRIK